MTISNPLSGRGLARVVSMKRLERLANYQLFVGSLFTTSYLGASGSVDDEKR